MMRIVESIAGALMLLPLLQSSDVRAEMDEVERLLQQDRTVESLQLIEERLKESPEDLSIRELRLDLRVGMGFGAGEVARLDELVKVDPGNADAWYLLGRAVLDMERSRAAYEQALRLAPNHARSWMGQGSLQELEDDCAKAEESYAHALTLDVELQEAWVGHDQFWCDHVS